MTLRHLLRFPRLEARLIKDVTLPFDTTTLLLAWFAGGFILSLAWAAIMGQALLGPSRQAVGPAIGVLALIGLLHPVGAVGAVDLVNLARSLDEPDLQFPRWATAATLAVLAASIAIALGLWIAAGGAS